MVRRFPFYKQYDQKDCGPTCLRIIAKSYGRTFKIQKIRDYCQINKQGVNLLGISEAAEKLGFRTIGTQLQIKSLIQVELPCILHWNKNHFVVLYKIGNGRFFIADPAVGLVSISERELKDHWIGRDTVENGTVLLLSPSPYFYELPSEKTDMLTWPFMIKYVIEHKQLISQLVIGLLVGTILQLITPFLTQSVVDIGINTKNISFVYMILIAQVMLFFGTASVSFIRSWVLLHLTTRINISILTDFLIKLMRLPISFYDSRTTGDIMQRMGDQGRIESFLTGSTLGTLFSLLNMIIFAFVLAYYDTTIFIVYLVSTIAYTLWIIVFLEPRRRLDYQRFSNSSLNQSNIIELISGMPEIKLNNCEQQKRWNWEHIQVKLFNFSIKSLTLSQYQEAGAMFINQSKNILITFISVKAVIDGEITMGGMMAIQFIIGQLNSPISMLLGFIQQYQDAKISLERLNEIHSMEDEEPIDKYFDKNLPKDKTLNIKNLSFRYPGAGNDLVLDNVSFQIPEGKTTAIVGMSGSGKTTILKLILRFYEAESGAVHVGNVLQKSISYKAWRSECGAVLQDGFLFSDTIANNIAVGDEFPDKEKLDRAIEVANIKEFIDELPNGVNTIIGSGGKGVSQGQKQRILIARSVYKNPHYILFDEATNSLDAKNERIILDNLKDFFGGRTVIVVAHRLSTVTHADNIIVLDKGRITEQGSHNALLKLEGTYFELIRNQMELQT